MPNPPSFEQDSRAFYRPSTDAVGMPSRSAFESAEKYYSTLFHELTHSTGHPSRVGREGIMEPDLCTVFGARLKVQGEKHLGTLRILV